MIVNSWGISPRVSSVVAHVWYQSHTIISVSPARVLQSCFKKLYCSQIKLAISAVLESGQNASGATEKVAALVARATCSGASHSSGCLHDCSIYTWMVCCERGMFGCLGNAGIAECEWWEVCCYLQMIQH